jgi:hypothetical protein
MREIYRNKYFLIFLVVVYASLFSIKTIAQRVEISRDRFQALFKLVSTDWQKPPLHLSADMEILTGFEKTTIIDTSAIQIDFWVDSTGVYGKYGDFEWITDQKVSVLIDRENKLIRKVDSFPSIHEMNGSAFVEKINALVTQCNLHIENISDSTTKLICFSNQLLAPGMPALEFEILFNNIRITPIYFEVIQRELKPYNESDESDKLPDSALLNLPIGHDLGNKALVSFVDIRYNYHTIENVNIGRIPARIHDRIQMQPNGEWVCVQAYENFFLMED